MSHVVLLMAQPRMWRYVTPFLIHVQLTTYIIKFTQHSAARDLHAHLNEEDFSLSHENVKPKVEDISPLHDSHGSVCKCQILQPTNLHTV